MYMDYNIVRKHFKNVQGVKGPAGGYHQEYNILAYIIIAIYKEHNMRVLQEYLLVQRSLVQQVLAVIEPKYLSLLRNRITGKIPSEICALVLHLFLIYRKITTQSLRKMYNDTPPWSTTSLN